MPIIRNSSHNEGEDAPLRPTTARPAVAFGRRYGGQHVAHRPDPPSSDSSPSGTVFSRRSHGFFRCADSTAAAKAIAKVQLRRFYSPAQLPHEPHARGRYQTKKPKVKVIGRNPYHFHDKSATLCPVGKRQSRRSPSKGHEMKPKQAGLVGLAAAVLVPAGCGSTPRTQGIQAPEPTAGVLETTGILNHQKALIAQERDLYARWQATSDPGMKEDIRHQFCDNWSDIDGRLAPSDALDLNQIALFKMSC